MGPPRVERLSALISKLTVGGVSRCIGTLRHLIRNQVGVRPHGPILISEGDIGRSPGAGPEVLGYGLRMTFVYPSSRRSNLRYASVASSSGNSWDTTKLGLALPAAIRSLR